MIEISNESLKRVETILAGVPSGVNRALSSAMNRGLSKIKTQAFAQIPTVYTVDNSALKNSTKIKKTSANGQNPIGQITFGGNKIPLYKFSVTPRVPQTRQTIKAKNMYASAGGEFPHAFIARMPNGHIGVFEREKKSRYPIKEKMALATAQMLNNETVKADIEEQAQKTIEQRLEHEISRILNGYG